MDAPSDLCGPLWLLAGLTLLLGQVGCDFDGGHVRYEPRATERFVSDVEEIPAPQGAGGGPGARSASQGYALARTEEEPSEGPAAPPPGLSAHELLAWSVVHGGALRLPSSRVAGLTVQFEQTWALVQDPALPPGCAPGDLGCFGWIMQRQGDRYVVAKSGLVAGLGAPEGMPPELLASFEGEPLGQQGLAAAADPEAAAAAGFQASDDASAVLLAVQAASQTGGRSVLGSPEQAPSHILDGWALVFNQRLPPLCQTWSVGEPDSHPGGCFAYLFQKRGEGWHLVGSGGPQQLIRRPGLPEELGVQPTPLLSDD